MIYAMRYALYDVLHAEPHILFATVRKIIDKNLIISIENKKWRKELLSMGKGGGGRKE